MNEVTTLSNALRIVLAAWAKRSTSCDPTAVGEAIAESTFESFDGKTRVEWCSDDCTWNLPRSSDFPRAMSEGTTEEDVDRVIDALDRACHVAASRKWESLQIAKDAAERESLGRDE